jgi:hypothetical protein
MVCIVREGKVREIQKLVETPATPHMLGIQSSKLELKP